jgi:hypothetical protein
VSASQSFGRRSQRWLRTCLTWFVYSTQSCRGCQRKRQISSSLAVTQASSLRPTHIAQVAKGAILGRQQAESSDRGSSHEEGQVPATGRLLVAAGNDLAGQDEKLSRLRPIDRKPEKSALRPANHVLLPAHREQVMAVRRPGEVDQTLVAGRRNHPVLSALTAGSACDPQLLEAASDGPRSLARHQVCDEASIRGDC